MDRKDRRVRGGNAARAGRRMSSANYAAQAGSRNSEHSRFAHPIWARRRELLVMLALALAAALHVAFLAPASAQPTRTWNGSQSTDWHTPHNWHPNGEPEGTVVIPTAPRDAVISSKDIEIHGHLSITGTSSLTIENGRSFRRDGPVDIYVASPIGSAQLFLQSGATIIGAGGTIRVGEVGGEFPTPGTPGTGILTISGGASISSVTIHLADPANSNGALNIGAKAGDAPQAPGTITGSTIQFGAGTGLINFNHTSPSYAFDNPISGHGQVNVYAGTTSFNTDHTYTGTTTVHGGTLLVNGSIQTPTTILMPGTLGGNGTIKGDVTSFGTVSPGTSIGDLRITGAYVGHDHATLRIESVLAGNNSSTDHLILVGPMASAAGTTGIVVVNLNGPGALTTGNGIPVVIAQNGATTQTTAFYQGGPIAAGPFQYVLSRGTTGTADELNGWYLRSHGGGSPLTQGPGAIVGSITQTGPGPVTGGSGGLGSSGTTGPGPVTGGSGGLGGSLTFGPGPVTGGSGGLGGSTTTGPGPVTGGSGGLGGSGTTGPGPVTGGSGGLGGSLTFGPGPVTGGSGGLGGSTTTGPGPVTGGSGGLGGSLTFGPGPGPVTTSSGGGGAGGGGGGGGGGVPQGPVPAIGGGDGPLYRPETATYGLFPALARGLAVSTIGSFHERNGDQDLVAGSKRERMWGRIFGHHAEQGHGGHVTPSFEGHAAGFQVGADAYEAFWENGVRGRAGIFLGWAEARGDIKGSVLGHLETAAGDVQLEATSVGSYGTLVGHGGWYVDSILMTSFYSGDGQSANGISTPVDGKSVLASLEAGIPFRLGGGFTLEPQAQLIYQHLDFDNTVDAFSTVRFDTPDAVLGRIGVRLAGTFADGRFRPYLKANLWHDWLNGDSVIYADTHGLDTDHGGTALEVGGGLVLELSPGVGLWGVLDYTTDIAGDTEREVLRGNAGVRITW